MATIKFDRHDELDALVARLYLDSGKKLTKKELLDVIFEVGIEDYQELLTRVTNPGSRHENTSRKQFIERLSGALSITAGQASDIDPKTLWERKVD